MLALRSCAFDRIFGTFEALLDLPFLAGQGKAVEEEGVSCWCERRTFLVAAHVLRVIYAHGESVHGRECRVLETLLLEIPQTVIDHRLSDELPPLGKDHHDVGFDRYTLQGAGDARSAYLLDLGCRLRKRLCLCFLDEDEKTRNNECSTHESSYQKFPDTHYYSPQSGCVRTESSTLPHIFSLSIITSSHATLFLMSVSALILFIIILLALVIVHEFGHFIAAKWVGMRVDEFAFGFPPRLFAKKKGETTYAVNALPLGGYVSIWGENGEPDDEAKTHPRAFGNRPKWAQIVVLLAGVTMNMVLALLIFIGLSFGKVQMSTSDPEYGSRVKDAAIMVVDAAPNAPAYLAGIVPGSVIEKIVSAGVVAPLTSAEAVIAFIGKHQNDAFTVTYVKPDGVRETTTVAAVYGIIPDKKALGISVDSVGYVHTGIGEAIKIGSYQTYDITKQTIQGLWGLVTSIGEGKGVLDSLSGPIGIAQVVGKTSSYGYHAIFLLIAVLSVGVAIFNILPVPALDGGRVIIVLLEAIARRKIPFTVQMKLNTIGMSLLLLLFVVVTFNDILKIVHA